MFCTWDMNKICVSYYKRQMQVTLPHEGYMKTKKNFKALRSLYLTRFNFVEVSSITVFT